jgi:hypothetical protein
MDDQVEEAEKESGETKRIKMSKIRTVEEGN